MDLNRIQKAMKREAINGFLESLGIDVADVCEVMINPNRMIITRYLNNDDGTRQLDHLGPRTVESHFNILD